MARSICERKGLRTNMAVRVSVGRPARGRRGDSEASEVLEDDARLPKMLAHHGIPGTARTQLPEAPLSVGNMNKEKKFCKNRDGGGRGARTASDGEAVR